MNPIFTSPQKRAKTIKNSQNNQLNMPPSDPHDPRILKNLFIQQGINAKIIGDKIYLQIGTTNPNELRNLASTLEKLNVTNFTAILEYPKQ